MPALNFYYNKTKTNMSKMDLSSEEKIDLIYDMLEKQESRYKRALISKIIFRVLIIWFIVSFYTIILPKLNTSTVIKEDIAPTVAKILAPIISETMKETLKSVGSDAMTWLNSNLVNSINSTQKDMTDLQNTQTSWTIDSTKKAELLKRLKAMQNK